nr:helix-turn-helix domain-containing protein [Amycolatopsis nigrescens]
MVGRHLTISDLAERLGVPRRTVYQWNSRGDGPKYLKVGKHVRYRLADVEKWEKAHEAEGGRVA